VTSTPGGAAGKQALIACNWKDTAVRVWSVHCHVTVIPQEAFEGGQFRHNALRPGSTFRDEFRLVQHAVGENVLPPVPVFRSSDPRLRISSQLAKTESLADGWTRRIVTVQVECEAGTDPGFHATHVYADRPLPGITFEWQVRQLVVVSPVNLVLTRADFEPGDVVSRSFLVRGTEAAPDVKSAEITGLPDGLVGTTVRRLGQVGNVIDVESRWPNRTMNGNIVLRTGLTECPQVVIPVSYIAE
jgi:hypothetical protein